MAGALIGLARNCDLTRKLEILEVTSVRSPWGEIVIGRTHENCDAVLAGPVSLADLHKVIQVMKSYNPGLLIIDSTGPQKFPSDSSLTDSFAFSAGVECADRPELASFLRYQCQKLSLDCDRHSLSDPRQSGLWIRGEFFAYRDLQEIPLSHGKEAEAFFSPGAFSDYQADQLMRFGNPALIILAEPWQLLLSLEKWQSMSREGWRFKVRKRTRFLMASFNPLSQDGNRLEVEPYLNLMKSNLPDIPILNPLHE